MTVDTSRALLIACPTCGAREGNPCTGIGICMVRAHASTSIEASADAWAHCDNPGCGHDEGGHRDKLGTPTACQANDCPCEGFVELKKEASKPEHSGFCQHAPTTNSSLCLICGQEITRLSFSTPAELAGYVLRPVSYQVEPGCSPAKDTPEHLAFVLNEAHQLVTENCVYSDSRGRMSCCLEFLLDMCRRLACDVEGIVEEKRWTTVPRLRAGDVVLHRPSGEKWVLACDEERYEGQYSEGVICAGWPETIARAADCDLIQAATAEQHLDMLQKVAKHQDSVRGRRARRQLEEIQVPKVSMTTNSDETPE